MTKSLIVFITVFSLHAQAWIIHTIGYVPTGAPAADLKNACLGLTYDNIFCDKVKDPTLNSFCNGVTHHIDDCYGIADGDLFHSCRSLATLDSEDISEITAVNECSQIKNQDLKRVCKAFFYHAASDCEKVTDPTLKSFCTSVYWDFFDGPHCDQMPTEALKNYCLGLTYKGMYCDFIPVN